MSQHSPQSFGRRKTFKATCIGLAILFLISLIRQTNGDFANGILFFIASIINLPVLIVLGMLFLFTYFLAGKAATDIIINKQHFAFVAFKSWITIALVLVSLMLFIEYIVKGDFPWNEDLTLLLISSIPLLAVLLIVWLWAANQMRIFSSKQLRNGS